MINFFNGVSSMFSINSVSTNNFEDMIMNDLENDLTIFNF